MAKHSSWSTELLAQFETAVRDMSQVSLVDIVRAQQVAWEPRLPKMKVNFTAATISHFEKLLVEKAKEVVSALIILAVMGSGLMGAGRRQWHASDIQHASWSRSNDHSGRCMIATCREEAQEP